MQFKLIPVMVLSFVQQIIVAQMKNFVANSTGNKFMILENFSNPIINKYVNVLNNNNIDIAGIEFLEDEEGVIYLRY